MQYRFIIKHFNMQNVADKDRETGELFIYTKTEIVETDFVVGEDDYYVILDALDLARMFTVFERPSGNLILRTSDILRVDVEVVPGHEA